MKTVAKKDLERILSGWAEKYEVFAPVWTEAGECLLGCFTPQAFTLDYKKLPLSPKGLFLPPTEIIFQFERGDYRDVLSRKDRIIFGLRPCDMMGLLQASSFMTRDHQDIYYQSRLNPAITIVVACPQAQNDTCFCT
ncbi:MAG TPA: hypothetical protein P5040_07560, partial [Smithella sp.]|nr:hypothetical protein [Smithella sp.]